MHYLPDTERFKRMTTDEIRSHFLVQNLFVPGEATFRFIDLDRVILGGIVPTQHVLALEADEALAADYFAERREIGLLNIGSSGSVTVDGERYAMQSLDGLYVGRGSKDVSFESDDANTPARFYLVSYPAHTTYPTTHISQDEADLTELGSQEKANRRNLYKYIHPGGMESAQLVMGVTELVDGNVWNTMPAHTHARRTEAYLYFDVQEGEVVFHFMGEPQETRSLVVRNEEAILSPGWSIHAGAGTSRYTFCWAMGGENQDFADMQFVDLDALQ
ncbi:MAG TPA: 5-dehydro-4-deoxy-D-glucuronate isomerase [Rhodothermales bacterium]|nr:5-dehydro-4-deoxy-D-glucuronate isomerase [Rhodothermales bacterium]